MARPRTEVAALCVRRDSVYKLLGADAWDQERDARRWPGGCPVIAHPPCAQWGRLRAQATPDSDQLGLGPYCVSQVQDWGGVLEHPAGSLLWRTCGLPLPGAPADAFGGWTLSIYQYHWGHRASKHTWLYLVGVDQDRLPALPRREGEATHSIRPRKSRLGRLLYLPRWEREHTPVALGIWLMEAARRARV